MSTYSPTNLNARAAAEIALHVTLSPAAAALLRPGLNAGQFLQLLIDERLLPDACQFFAHALTKREAVWWACACSRRVRAANAPPEFDLAVQAAEQWVLESSDESRRAAFAASRAAQLRTPAGCAALAAFLSGGSLAPANLPEVAPGEHLTAQTVAGAVLLAGVQSQPEKAPDRYRDFLKLGGEIAAGSRPWK